ncbi:MAG: HEAT repeat domain-containing protein, partial [Pseudomonadota bacterium]
MTSVAAARPTSLDPVRVVTRHLQHDDAVIRCAAARALGALADQRAAPDLIQALRDEDPDVRTDSMAALVHCARPEDANAIRDSLIGDPVNEVKVAAIEALARLGDHDSIPLLRLLVRDRAEDQIAWEDDDGFDPWLDIQIEAIGALGDLGAAEAIDDLLEARVDELGQDLDLEVFRALARIPEGINGLLRILGDRDPRVRRRALEALSAAGPESLAPLRNLIRSDRSPEVRALAITCLAPDDPAVRTLALDDPA